MCSSPLASSQPFTYDSLARHFNYHIMSEFHTLFDTLPSMSGQEQPTQLGLDLRGPMPSITRVIAEEEIDLGTLALNKHTEDPWNVVVPEQSTSGVADDPPPGYEGTMSDYLDGLEGIDLGNLTLTMEEEEQDHVVRASTQRRVHENRDTTVRLQGTDEQNPNPTDGRGVRV